ncbi:MAG: glycoside hydrolase family 16 protein [Prolixibacteraceae bacterium]|jgi:beta-glucanase (GH16 family)|nr:glycoside hydrolase family 16 protein [Prolixibacteraceae bacterium]
MKIFLIATIIVMLLSSCSENKHEKYELVWSDEFEYEGLPDSTKWDFDTIGNAWGWGNHELQYYTYNEISNAQISNGTLKIIARKETIHQKEYSSARLFSKEKGDWLYGKIEVNAKLPDGKGLWPAIWMLPTDWEYGGWPRSGEIDIMENVGYAPDTIFCTVHTMAYNHSIGTQVGKSISIPDNRETFHVYAIEWDSTNIKGFVDNIEYFSFDKQSDNSDEWPFNKRFHLLLNTAVGGDWGGKYGVDDSIFPAIFEIDYVRIYQKKKNNE